MGASINLKLMRWETDSRDRVEKAVLEARDIPPGLVKRIEALGSPWFRRDFKPLFVNVASSSTHNNELRLRALTYLRLASTEASDNLHGKIGEAQKLMLILLGEGESKAFRIELVRALATRAGSRLPAIHDALRETARDDANPQLVSEAQQALVCFDEWSRGEHRDNEPCFSTGRDDRDWETRMEEMRQQHEKLQQELAKKQHARP